MLVFVALFVFTLELQFCSCHLKDLGEKDPRMSKLLEGFEDRILGGENTTLRDYPFNVQFFNFGGLCGGSILTRKTVLTAAHCFDHNTNVAEMKVLSNAQYVRHKRASFHTVWDFMLHEKYNQPNKYAHDVAMIIIHDIFKFGSTVQKAVLTNSILWRNETEPIFVATGWGINEYSTRRRALKKTTLRYVPDEECSDASGLQITNGMFCLFGDQERDTCRGDSGGGILWNNVVVGVVSHGFGCLKVPSVYMDVYYFRTWIRRSVETLYKKYCSFHSVKQYSSNL